MARPRGPRRRSCSRRSPAPRARPRARSTPGATCGVHLLSRRHPRVPRVLGQPERALDPSIVDRISFITGGWDADRQPERRDRQRCRRACRSGRSTGGVRVRAARTTAMASPWEPQQQQRHVGLLRTPERGKRPTCGSIRSPSTPATFKPFNYSNHGQDLYGFGKIEYQPGVRDQFYLEGNASSTDFQIPFDSANGIIADNQTDKNSFLNLGWHHITGSPARGPRPNRAARSSQGAFYRAGSLLYAQGIDDQPKGRSSSSRIPRRTTCTRTATSGATA